MSRSPLLTFTPRLLWSNDTETAMVISPFEADALLRTIRNSQQHSTHLLVYAAPVTRKMLCFNSFSFYSIPALPSTFQAPDWLVQEIGIFAGRLFFPFEEYHSICNYLGLNTQSGKQENSEDMKVDADSGSSLRTQIRRPFVKQPLSFMHEWLMIRRTSQDFSSSPMGHLCQGKRMSERDVFFGGSGEFVEDLDTMDVDTSEGEEVERDGSEDAVAGAEESDGDVEDGEIVDYEMVDCDEDIE